MELVSQYYSDKSLIIILHSVLSDLRASSLRDAGVSSCVAVLCVYFTAVWN